MSNTDDYSSTPSTTGALTVGGSALGMFENELDLDWFKIHLDAGTTYVFAMTPAPGSNAKLNYAILALKDPNGLSLSGWHYGSDDGGPAFQYKPGVGGDYFLSAEYYPSGANFAGIRYAVSAALQQADALSADIHTTGVLAAGVTMTGRFDVAGDVDWYKFHAEAGQHYTFSYPNSSVPPSIFGIYDVNGKQLTDNNRPLEPVISGDYFIAVGSNVAGDYALQVVNQVDDYSQDNSSAGILLAGGQITGKLDYISDTDRFNIRVSAGQAYTLELSGDARDSDILSFSVLDAQSTMMATSPLSNDADARSVTFKADTSGTYQVSVAYYGASHAGYDSYTLKASKPIADDFGDTTSSATPMTLGTAIAGKINFEHDVDVFKVALQAGTTYLLTLNNVQAGYANSLKVSDKYDQVVKTQHDAKANTSFTANATGDYYISVSGDQGSTYTLSATAPTDDVGATTAAAGELAVGGSVGGVLEHGGDRDWFAITMAAGATYAMSLKPAAGSALFDSADATTLNVVDAQGQVQAGLEVNRSAGGSPLSYRAAASGTYYIEVAAGQQTGGYVVSAALSAPDDVSDQPAGATRLESGIAFSGKLEVPIDKDVFKVAVVAGQYYGFLLEHAPGGKMPDLQGTDAQHYELGVNTPHLSDSDNTYQLYLANTTGDIYLTVSERPEDGANSYKLTATSLGSDDNASYRNGENTNLVVGAQVSGVLNYAGDRDLITVTLHQGESYQFNLQSSASQGLNAKYGYGVELYDAQDTEVAHSSAQYGGSFGYKALRSGNYYLSVHANVTDLNATGGYTLAASKMDAAPQLAAQPDTGAAAGIFHFLALDFTEQIKISDASGIVLRDSAGKEVVFNPSANASPAGTHLDLTTQWHLTPGATYTLDIAAGAIVDLAGNGYAGLHTTFTTVAAASAGTGGNDLLVGQSNGAAIHGGAGVDAVAYGDRSSMYHIVQHDGHAEINHWLDGGKDILDGVERLHFQDKSIALDIDGVGGQAYRLYQAAFNRAPDLGGLGYWIDVMDQGLSVRSAAGFFAGSAEFQQLYGDKLSDDAFITQLYSNVLHRAPDEGGKAYWLQVMHNDGVSRGDALGFFSESQENQIALIGKIGNGFEYIPAAG
ncbi:DUF4214 domain-containing protein [Duganella violaceipulchra]|uniref:DUF4214 domain-containing protein n=1 Tax=Duganella violaceipulchra TaxID=2849652 RepID=A0AA41H6U6_9BURK|nr:DUF4214 domain-containing protein [Duganella violaceicalia]MBV6321540.1 DUF4214 domain-containing protein [Duganella violaceicalia]MCP2008201.1 hypothetical protein [Duganella violaceicalia]